ncbi:Oxygen-dependent coproporphyrinogen-III oxidase [Sparassis crispa]|uniref:coproporphyrinogen oxidase n=1 Tax=Sparassis crispa TaxID=139825 RepID=A0A401GT98_9APHY|nr:Oxygen-dependent coproporphyrinogen-III oxidase [Sparassis crispa]GBE85462.1 Oxygen-dependent coproporphyrinogen-III oxidase [Sparassis crispa]
MTTASPVPMRKQVEDYISKLQVDIVEAFEKLDPSAPPFKRDSWVRAQGGRGLSCVFAVDPAEYTPEAAAHFALEKAGVNISVVHGLLPPAAIKQMRADHGNIPDTGESLPFFAAGISLVVHPRNPHAPTTHANYRYFELAAPHAEGAAAPKVLAWWFGGGADLTPFYLYAPDAQHFHATHKAACAPHGAAVYPAFKKWCDEYFYIPHRQETRGVGGVFLDDLSGEPHKRFPGPADAQRPRTQDAIFALVRALGDAFVPAYLPVLARRCATPSDARARRWQLLRRGRYVEFNLVYDRGTKFGLATPGARIESILMSLPETARWEYQTDMGAEGTEEAELVEVLKNPREWA